ncbi:hypothetical protein Dimus_009599 [Dionaea muscipula]
MQSTISGLKEERENLYMALEEKNNEIKTLQEQDVNSSKEPSQMEALREILKQKDAEIDQLKNPQMTPVKVWSVLTDDPSNPPKNLTSAVIDVSRSRQPDHWPNLSNRSQNETSIHEDGSNNLSTYGEAHMQEGVHLVEKTEATEEPNKLENQINEADTLNERRTEENQWKYNGESQGKGDSTIAQENSTEAQKTSNKGGNTPPALDSQAIGNVHRGGGGGGGGLRPERIDSSGKISDSRRHRRHRGKRWRESMGRQRMGRVDHPETKKPEDVEKKFSPDTVESQNNDTREAVVPNSERTGEAEIKHGTGAEDAQLTASNDQSQETASSKEETGAQDAQLTLSEEHGKETTREDAENKHGTGAQDAWSTVSNERSKETASGEEAENKHETDAQVTVSDVQTKETASGGQNGEGLTEKEHYIDKFPNIPLSIEQQETQKPEHVTDQTDTAVGTEQNDHQIIEEEQAANAGNENIEASMPNNESKQNSSNESKQPEEQEPEVQAQEEHLDVDNRENGIKQVTEKEEPEDPKDADAGLTEIDAAADNSFTESKSMQAEVKEGVEEEEETKF